MDKIPLSHKTSHQSSVEIHETQGSQTFTHILQISAKLEKEVFLVPTRITCGGFITKRFFSPATISGFFSRMMSNTRFSSCDKRCVTIGMKQSFIF